MATELRSYAYPGGIAGADFSVGGGLSGQNGNGNASGQFLFVALNGTEDTFVPYLNDNIKTGYVPVGISQNDPTLGGQLSVMCLGRSKIVAGSGGIAIGQEVGAEALTGRGVAKAATLTGANLGDFVMGICSCAAAQGAVGSVELIGRYRV
jgi:hypothetical protein